MRLTHLADYAVVMMTAAARRDPSSRLSATELADETGVPLPTAQKLMQKLAAHGLLVGQRGAGGGYALARPVTEISLADIVEAVEGPIVLTMCADGVNHECALDAHCKVKPHMSIVGDAIRSSLEAVTLEQLRSPAKAGAQTRREAAPSTPGWTSAFAGARQS
jgi:FeS assembly SUF system regulator